eukprot:Plantae.Rhodophyta-Rhodochaete_pulchella.ctg14381.p1 GENE.Plantae.Rhodophyta-Rhodochaete_pulchella.ctg14381~~Plantae.Rhodophyta-Rhodochaete_pulchella.ctg14381.p1  ORF type:complete len:285 (-),score=37.10 Plantae.Rhodophyta-Rhodochaete_pulchella.ctg14381:197-1030(-)
MVQLLGPRKSRFESVDFFGDYLEIALGTLSFSLHGSICFNRPVKKMELINARTCNFLLSAEYGVYEGPLSDTREQVMQSVRWEFYTAVGQCGPVRAVGFSGPLTTHVLSLKCFCAYNQRRGLLTKSAACGVMERYGSMVGGERVLTLREFTRFIKAVQAPGSVNALQYFWSVLDRDLDGFLSMADLRDFFRDKAEVLSQQGLMTVDLTHIFWNLCDMCMGSNVPRTGAGAGLSLWHLRTSSDRDRGFLVRAMLFREDDLIVLDFKRTMDASSTARAP